MAFNGPRNGHTEPLRDRFSSGLSHGRQRSTSYNIDQAKPRQYGSTAAYPRPSRTRLFEAGDSHSYTQPIGSGTELRFEESAKRLRELVELRSPRKKLQKAPIAEQNSLPQPEAEAKGNVRVMSTSPPEARRHASTSPITRKKGFEIPSQGVHTPPTDPQRTLGIRRQWDLNTSQFEPLRPEADKSDKTSTSNTQENEVPTSGNVNAANVGSQKKLPSAKDLVERMIAYSRNMANEPNAQTAPGSSDSARLPLKFAKLQSLGASDNNTPTVLAPSPLLSEKPGPGFQKQGNITMHTDLNTFKWPALSRTAPIRPPPRFIRNHSHPAPKNETNTLKMDINSRNPAPHRARMNTISQPIATPKTRTRPSNRQASTPTKIAVSESHSAPFVSASQREESLASQSAVQAQNLTPAAFIPSSDKSEALVLSSGNSGSRDGKSQSLEKRKNSKWKEIQWRQFSIAMRDSIAEQKLSLKCAVSLLTGMRERLPPEMHNLSLDEIVKRLVVWIDSTEGLQTVGGPNFLSQR